MSDLWIATIRVQQGLGVENGLRFIYVCIYFSVITSGNCSNSGLLNIISKTNGNKLNTRETNNYSCLPDSTRSI